MGQSNLSSSCLAAVLALALGCSAADSSDGSGADADSDTDTDTGTDSDTWDTGDGSDTDSGSDSGSGSDTGTDADTDADTDTDTDADTDTDTGPYSHTIEIDGVNDFTSAETFATTSEGYSGYLAWDGAYFYLGMEGPDVGAGGTRWLLAYLSGTPGSAVGQTYNTQQPTLPFDAAHHLRWRTDGGYTNVMEWSGSAWQDAGWDFAGDVYHDGQYVEVRLPRGDLGAPTLLSAHLSMVDEADGSEWTYAGVPETSFSDGLDPDYQACFEFDLNGNAAPGDYSPQ
ncbi:MAG: hypothetical protein R6V85_10770 [Polyangia bacterium]